MRTITTRTQRGVSLVLVLCMCITAGPVQALAAAQPTVLPTAWSAPFEQPEPVNYEQQNARAAADEKMMQRLCLAALTAPCRQRDRTRRKVQGRPSPGEAEKTAPPQQSPDSAEPTTAPGETPTTGAGPQTVKRTGEHAGKRAEKRK